MKKFEFEWILLPNPIVYMEISVAIVRAITRFPSLSSMIFSRPVNAPQNIKSMLEVSMVYTSPLSELPPVDIGFPERPRPVRTRPGRCLSDIYLGQIHSKDTDRYGCALHKLEECLLNSFSANISSVCCSRSCQFINLPNSSAFPPHECDYLI